MPRGGSRKGSGRKSVDDNKKRPCISICVAPVTKERVDTLRSQGVKVGRLFDQLLEEHWENRK